jgi:2-iminobutanoate/2-iminopropanoate deaminase
MKEFRNPQEIHKPVGAYTHQIKIRGSERLLVISGQVGVHMDGTVPEDPIEQLDLAFDNILSNLRAANMDVKDIVKLNYYLVGESDMAKRREVILAKLQGHQPCSTLVFVSALASPMLRVEIEAWASHAQA